MSYGKRRLEIGRQGEDAACAFLMGEGFEILARNLRTPFGEIDILAREGSDLVFVEVKARATIDAALEAVDGRKQRRIGRMAASLEGSLRQWLGRTSRRYDQEYGFSEAAAEDSTPVRGIRFDVVAVRRGSSEVVLVRAAFDGPDGC
jgi:Holliday junction resolvase-like predicted endonuclease